MPMFVPPRNADGPMRLPEPIMQFKGFEDRHRYNEWKRWCQDRQDQEKRSAEEERRKAKRPGVTRGV